MTNKHWVKGHSRRRRGWGGGWHLHRPQVGARISLNGPQNDQNMRISNDENINQSK
jgi:hypothetical protein